MTDDECVLLPCYSAVALKARTPEVKPSIDVFKPVTDMEYSKMPHFFSLAVSVTLL